MNHSETPLSDDMTELDNEHIEQVDLDNPMLHVIDDEEDIDNSAGFSNSQVGSDATQGLTPIHRQNIDESRIDEILVEDNLDDVAYPDIVDIADKDAAEYSNNDEL